MKGRGEDPASGCRFHDTPKVHHGDFITGCLNQAEIVGVVEDCHPEIGLQLTNQPADLLLELGVEGSSAIKMSPSVRPARRVRVTSWTALSLVPAT